MVNGSFVTGAVLLANQSELMHSSAQVSVTCKLIESKKSYKLDYRSGQLSCVTATSRMTDCLHLDI